MKISLKIAILFISLNSFGQSNIHFEHSSWNSIVQKAKEQNKLIFMDAYTEWCGPCKMMAKNVFTDPKVSEYFNANFINAKIEMETGEGPIIAEKYPVRGYPSLFFIDPKNGKIINQALGYRNPEQMLQLANAVLQKK